MRPRQSNNPKRRISAQNAHTFERLRALGEALVYSGSAHHKRHPGNYGFRPPVNPRPWKSMCDSLREIDLEEAIELFRKGIRAGMISECGADEKPKYVWSVDDHGEAFEAKLGIDGYHGYCLEDEDNMRAFILREWKVRCREG
jgi:hypothetical protein